MSFHFLSGNQVPTDKFDRFSIVAPRALGTALERGGALLAEMVFSERGMQSTMFLVGFSSGEDMANAVAASPEVRQGLADLNRLLDRMLRMPPETLAALSSFSARQLRTFLEATPAEVMTLETVEGATTEATVAFDGAEGAESDAEIQAVLEASPEVAAVITGGGPEDEDVSPEARDNLAELTAP